MAVVALVAFSVCVAPATPTPDVAVVMFWLLQPLVPVKVKVPVPPTDTLVRVSFGKAY
ncbi:MAG: hypothetical protein U1E15_07815 [Hyphomicrobiales bacterium]